MSTPVHSERFALTHGRRSDANSAGKRSARRHRAQRDPVSTKQRTLLAFDNARGQREHAGEVWLL